MIFDVEVSGVSVCIIERESLEEAQILCNDLYPDCVDIRINEIIFSEDGVWTL